MLSWVQLIERKASEGPIPLKIRGMEISQREESHRKTRIVCRSRILVVIQVDRLKLKLEIRLLQKQCNGKEIISVNYYHMSKDIYGLRLSSLCVRIASSAYGSHGWHFTTHYTCQERPMTRDTCLEHATTISNTTSIEIKKST